MPFMGIARLEEQKILRSAIAICLHSAPMLPRSGNCLHAEVERPDRLTSAALADLGVVEDN